MSPITYPTGFGAISDGIDLVIMDLWGCMHDGVTAYPAAIEVLRRLQQRGITVALVSNAPRRIEAVRPRLRQLGITDDLYAGLYTSGDMIWRHLASRADPAYRTLGRKAYIVGASDDEDFFTGLDCTLVESVAAADFAIVFGVADEHARVEDFDATLAAARARGLSLICANPDLMVHRGGIAEICAGAIAEAYGAHGGKVLIEGKPHPGIYRRVMADFKIADPARVLGVGDALRTDVAGAAAMGARSLLIAGGIHHADLLRGNEIDRAALDRLTTGVPRPTFVLPYLGW